MTAVELDLFSPAAVADPYAVFDHLRDTDPVHWSPRYRSWIVTRHADVSAALRDARFSSDRISPFVDAKLSGPDADPALRQTFAVLADWMVFKDPPDHTRLRRLLRTAFTPRSVAALEPRVRALSDELLDAVAGAGRADLVGSYAYPLTAAVIAEMLGVPAADRDLFKGWSDSISALVFAGLGTPSGTSAPPTGCSSCATTSATWPSGPPATPATTWCPPSCRPGTTTTASATTRSSPPACCCCSPGTRRPPT
ncbi:hypothetical protein ACFQX8_12765 [Klenkia terrae]|uniref:hypothetical protein n=1 Tax=Klenkia terrae TaxID=1052259 RepID=UPI00361D89F9